MRVLNDLLEYNKLKIYQDTDMFSFSLDSILLANFVIINKSNNNILDIGTGNAVIPLVLSTKIDAHIIGVEIQKEVFELARKSVTYNNLENQITILNQDIKEYADYVNSEQYDIITCNPPFFKLHENSNKNDSLYKTIARHEVCLNLEDIFKISRKLLKNGGKLAIVHRPERLIDIIILMRQNNLEPKRIQFIYPKQNLEANMLLIEATKNGKPGMKIMKPLYVHLENGEYTEEIKKYFK